MRSISGTILVVDDNDDNRDLLTRLLKRQGHTIVSVGNGYDALDLVKSQPFDLILLDMMMPGIDGYQVLEQLKAMPNLRHIPVIMISARDDIEVTTKCIAIGAEDYIPKPFSPILLQARVNASMEKKWLREWDQASLLARLAQLHLAENAASNSHTPEPDTALGNIATDPLFSTDEAIQRMLDALEHAQIERQRAEEELRALNATLEQRVAERSAAAEQKARELADSERTVRQQKRILQSILDSMGDGVVVTDQDGQLLHLNPAAASILDDSLPAMLPNGGVQDKFRYCDMVTPYTPDQLPLARAVRGELVDAVEIFVARDDTATVQWLSITARPLQDEPGGPQGAVAVFRDVSAAIEAQVTLRESEERYALAARGANDGLWDWDIKKNQIYFSPRWKTMLGYEEETIGNSPQEWFDRIHPEDQERVQVHLAAHFKGLITHFAHEHRVLHADGGYRWMFCRGLAIFDDQREVTRMAGSQTDITDRKKAEEQLSYGALHDTLTHLPNRTLFTDRLAWAIGQTKRRNDYRFAVLFLDFDRFKVINDSLGHIIGDQLLIAVARRLDYCLRPGDTVARLGGDEFTILLEGIGHDDDAIQIAERIQRELSTPFTLNGHEVFTSVSIGITHSNIGYEQPEDVLRDADIAMYHAKARGKARHAVFDATMHAHAMALLELEADLRHAIERDEFAVYYEPIILLETGQIAGFEALVRWQHPQRGFMPPLDFVPVAEENGLIIAIDRWVLRRACQQMHMWHQQFPDLVPLSVSVNLSSKQFVQPDLVEFVAKTLEEIGLNPCHLKLEITESTLMENGEIAIATLQKLRELGVYVCIDDFGTGYSSLSYLQRFPINALKIDRSFVKDLEANVESIEIVQAIVSLARTLGMEAIAEGTETVEQLAHLRTLQCDYGQGWFFSKAMDSKAAEALIAAEMGNALAHQRAC